MTRREQAAGPLRPKRGDIYVKLYDREGSFTVLIPKENVRPHHIAAMTRIGKMVGDELLRAPTNALVEAEYSRQSAVIGPFPF